MQLVELQEFFGAKVLVQFREGVALATTSGKAAPYPLVSPSGEPRLGPGGQVAGAKQILPELPEEGSDDKPRYVLALIGSLLPAADDKRVSVLYEIDGPRKYLVRMSIRPEDIYQVSWIEGASEESQIIQSAS